jgi:hypothetical protein
VQFAIAFNFTYPKAIQAMVILEIREEDKDEEQIREDDNMMWTMKSDDGTLLGLYFIYLLFIILLLF